MPDLTARAVTATIKAAGLDLFSSSTGADAVSVTQRYAVRGALTPRDTHARREQAAIEAEAALVAAGYAVVRTFDRLTVTLPPELDEDGEPAVVRAGQLAPLAEQDAPRQDLDDDEEPADGSPPGEAAGGVTDPYTPRVAHLMDEDLLAACGSHAEDVRGLLVMPSSRIEDVTCRRCLLTAVEEETRRLGYITAAAYLQAAGREQLRARVEVAAYAPDGPPIPVDAILCDCSAAPGPHLAHCDDCSAPADACVCEPAVDDDPREQPRPLEWSEVAGPTG